METVCAICGCEVAISMDEFIEAEQNINEMFFCKECAEIAHDWIVEMQIKAN